MFRLAVVASLVAYAASQSISQQCITAFTTVAADPAASTCLSIGALVPVFTTGANASIIQPFNNWLGSMCAQPACSNATLAAVVQNITAGCPTEVLSIAGIASGHAAGLTTQIQAVYPTTRKIFCLKNGDTFCVTETLTNIEALTGPLTLSNVVNLTQGDASANLPANVTCTNCFKESYNVLFNDFPSVAASAKPALESKCGASFVDGQTPSGISQSANTAVASGSSSNASNALGGLSFLRSALGMALSASALIVVSTICIVLA